MMFSICPVVRGSWTPGSVLSCFSFYGYQQIRVSRITTCFKNEVTRRYEVFNVILEVQVSRLRTSHQK